MSTGRPSADDGGRARAGLAPVVRPQLPAGGGVGGARGPPRVVASSARRPLPAAGPAGALALLRAGPGGGRAVRGGLPRRRRAQSCWRAVFSARGGGGGWPSTSCPDEIARWRAVDPALDLRVEDARALSFGDASFDAVACVSVIEHVPGDGDAAAMAEIWRVLRPGGVLHLTTNVAAHPREIRTARPVYGDLGDGRDRCRRGRGRLLRAPLHRGHPPPAPAGPALARGGARVRARASPGARAVLRGAPAGRSSPEACFPLSCARNFAAISGPGVLAAEEHGVVYLRLRRPGGAPPPGAPSPAE